MVMTSLQKETKEFDEKFMNIGFTIRQVGIGDGIQFTSLPENFFKKTGRKLIDVSQPWYLDSNPYILRDVQPKRVVELWNYPKIYEWSPARSSVYMSNAEIHLNVMGLKNPHLIRPRLYRFEEYPFRARNKILFHPFGKSHGSLPDDVIGHVLNKYSSKDLYQIGSSKDPSIGIPRIETPTLWDLVEVISQARMLIGIDSGPAWIAGCYPDVVIKKIRAKFQFGYCDPQDWIPLDTKNEHSFWDDRMFQIYNTFEEDCGFTYSYKKL